MSAFLSILAAAQAATLTAPATPPEPIRFTKNTFYSPAGEPFRAYDDSNPLVTWFKQADSNGDGKLDRGEFTADFMRYFKVLDRDGDGAIDGTERTYYEEHIAPETGGGSAWGAYGSTESGSSETTGEWQSADGSTGIETKHRKKDYEDLPPQGAGRFDLFGLPEPVAAMDVEIRGRVTRDTAQYVAGLRFQQLDRDNKGYLTLESLPRTYAEQRLGLKR
jgi:hypothetical protein